MTSPPCHSSQYKCKCPVKHWCTGAFMWLSALSTYSTCSSSSVRQGCSSWSRPLWGAALSANRRHECVIWKINWSFREGKLRGLRWEHGMHSFISSHNHVSHCLPCTAFICLPHFYDVQVLVLRLRDSVVRLGEELEQSAQAEARERENARYFQQRLQDTRLEMEELSQREQDSSRRRMELVTDLKPLPHSL